MSKKKSFLKVVILGDSGVGKTTLLQQFVSGKVTGNSKPTIGADFSKKEVMIDGQNVTLQIWDTAGQEKFQSLGYAFYRGADCCVLCYDITSKNSFENLNKWKQGFIENAGPEDISSFPFILIGNKVDRENERKVETREAEDWARKNGDILFYETSAKEGIKVETAFHEVAKKSLVRSSTGNIFMPDSIGGASGALKLQADKEKGNQRKSTTKSSCC